MAAPPQHIRALKNEQVLEIQWPEESPTRFPFHFLRCECPCAACVNEFTGERLLDPQSVPPDIAPAAIEFSGNYALKILWSDGHNTGLYSWDHLDRLRRALRTSST